MYTSIPCSIGISERVYIRSSSHPFLTHTANKIIIYVIFHLLKKIDN